MRHLKKHLERVSLEDAENSEAGLTPKDPVIENVASEPEEIKELDPTELVDPEPAADSVRLEMVEIEDMSVAIEEFQALIKGSESRGGLRAEEGAIVGAALKHFNKRLGIQEKETLGMEDFGGTMSRMKATQISQEAFADTAKAAGAKIKDLIAKLLAFLKEKAAAFDAQGVKVKGIVTQIKQHVKTIVTGEIELEFDGNRVGEIDILNPKKLGDAAAWAATLCTHMGAHIHATTDEVKKLARSDGSESDIRAFNESIQGMWGGGSNPVLAVMVAYKTVGVPLTSGYRTVMVHKDTANGGTGILSHSLELRGDGPKPVKMKMTKGQYIHLLDATEKMNEVVRQMISAYAENAGKIGGVSGGMNSGTPQAEASVSKVVSNLVTLVEGDINPIISAISAARGELGYICAIAAKKFGL